MTAGGRRSVSSLECPEEPPVAASPPLTAFSEPSRASLSPFARLLFFHSAVLPFAVLLFSIRARRQKRSAKNKTLGAGVRSLRDVTGPAPRGTRLGKAPVEGSKHSTYVTCALQRENQVSSFFSLPLQYSGAFLCLCGFTFQLVWVRRSARTTWMC